MTEQSVKDLQEKLLHKPENLGVSLAAETIASAMDFCEDYKTFLDRAKTEREAVIEIESRLIAQGYVPFEVGKKYVAGDKVYYNNRGKALVMATVGTTPMDQGVHIMASHVDSPRIDLKPRPLYEQTQLALFKTHYYGGLRKYQWGTIPLALHGTVVKADGSKVNICVGEDPSDPIFCITDLLPHLGQDQAKRPLAEGLKGEELNILIGSLSYQGDDISERVKLNIMQILHEKYGIVESDFISADIEMVPAHLAKDVGFDRSMVGAYGQDDRVCAYTSLMAAMACGTPEKTLVTVFADREEIGSEGNTGLRAAYLRYFIADLAAPYGIEARTVLSRSKCLSADVSAGFDPTFPEVNEKNNAAYLNYGVSLNKYTGARGKGGTSEATAEFVGEITKMLTDNDVVWQMSELGKVDQGGGGTVAMYIANLGIDVIDIGVPVLSMHAPLEVTAKLDIYMAYKAFEAFAKH